MCHMWFLREVITAQPYKPRNPQTMKPENRSSFIRDSQWLQHIVQYFFFHFYFYFIIIIICACVCVVWLRGVCKSMQYTSSSLLISGHI